MLYVRMFALAGELFFLMRDTSVPGPCGKFKPNPFSSLGESEDPAHAARQTYTQNDKQQT